MLKGFSFALTVGKGLRRAVWAVPVNPYGAFIQDQARKHNRTEAKTKLY